MKRIIIPIDFSETSKKAIHFALELYGDQSLEIELLNVVSLPSGLNELSMISTSVIQDSIDELKKAADLTLTKLALNYPKENVRFSKRVALGSFIEWFKSFEEYDEVDLIILGTSGASGLQEFFIGSNAQKVVRHTYCPVITVPEGYMSGHNENIVVAYDEDVVTQELVSALNDLNLLNETKVHFLRVLTPHEIGRKDYVIAELSKIIADNGIKNYSINFHNNFDPVNGILEFTNEINGNMIALFTHGRTGVAGLLNQSVTEGVVNHSEVPVIAINTRNFSFQSVSKESVA